MNNNTMNKESCGFGKKCKRGYKPSPVNRELYTKLKINAIRNSNKYSEEFDLKMESLQNMFNSKILSIREFNLRKNEIIEYYQDLNKLELEKEKKKNQLKILDKALENKTISEEEYLKKIDWFDLK